MLKDLTSLFSTTSPQTPSTGYRTSVIAENVLTKPSASTRGKTYRFLRDRYALDPDVPIFNVLRLFWDRDQVGQPLMALLVAAFRDPILRSTIPAMVDRQVDQAIPSREFAQTIEAAFPGKLTPTTLTSTSENTTSTYKQSGHLRGRRNCIRQRVAATAGSATIALLLATLEGRGGQTLLESDWVRLLDSPGELVLAEARVASSRGWLEYRHAGDILEISFRQLMSEIGVTSELR